LQEIHLELQSPLLVSSIDSSVYTTLYKLYPEPIKASVAMDGWRLSLLGRRSIAMLAYIVSRRSGQTYGDKKGTNTSLSGRVDVAVIRCLVNEKSSRRRGISYHVGI
jgi:hypothetical protein